jgi:hypothetical protein
MVNERIGEIVPGEKLFRFHVIGGRGARRVLLQVDGELAGIERVVFAEFLARENDFVPGFHNHRITRTRRILPEWSFRLGGPRTEQNLSRLAF